MKIILAGRVPSKKNSTISFARRGRIFHMPSNKYREWHKGAAQQLRFQMLNGYKENYPLENIDIEICFYPPDKRIADLTNKAESIMDLLVDCGVLTDDNWFVVGNLHLKLGEVDTATPRTEITLHGK